jgi:putative endonuclease
MIQKTSYQKGVQSEVLASTLLANNGYTLLAQRYKVPYGEIDLVMVQGDSLVFVEVKCRKNYKDAAESITLRQQIRIQNAAESFMQANPDLVRKCTFIRFDVVLICNSQPPVHLQNAWQVEG